jgi:hypothetical protein
MSCGRGAVIIEEPNAAAIVNVEDLSTREM